MKENQNEKSFFAGLFVTSIIGVQMVEATRVKCPDAASIQHTIVQGTHGYMHKYTGFATGPTGAKMYVFTNMDDRATDPLRHPQDPASASAGGNSLACLYENLTLSTDDTGAVKHCQDDAGTAYFNCH